MLTWLFSVTVSALRSLCRNGAKPARPRDAPLTRTHTASLSMSDFERESSVASFPSYEEDEEAVAADDIDDDGAGTADAHDYDRDSARMRVPMHAHHS